MLMQSKWMDNKWMQIDVDAMQIDVDAKKSWWSSSEGYPRDGCSRDAFQIQVISIPTKVWLTCLKITFCDSASSSSIQARRWSKALSERRWCKTSFKDKCCWDLHG
jgi:hypothetical protein